MKGRKAQLETTLLKLFRACQGSRHRGGAGEQDRDRSGGGSGSESEVVLMLVKIVIL